MTDGHAPATADVKRALERLGAGLDALRFLAGTAQADGWEERRRTARRLFQGKICLEASGRPSPPKLVFAGGTNVGKSTLFNRILGEVISAISPLARFTKSAVLYVHADLFDETVPSALLPGYPREAVAPDPATGRVSPVGGSAPGQPEPDRPRLHCRLHRREDHRGLHLLDSPDIDSTFARNLTTAEDLFFLGDGVLFVTTPEKYNDEICVHYLQRAVKFQKRLWVLLNKCSSPEVARDLRQEIVAGLTAGGGDASRVSVHEVPYLRNPLEESGAWLEALRAIPAAALADPEAKPRAWRGALDHLDSEVQALLQQVHFEQAYLDEFASGLARLHKDAEARYLAFQEEQEFIEIDQVYDRVLREFRVPVVDDVYDALGRFSSRIVGRVRALAGGPSKSPAERKIEERLNRDRDMVKTLVQSLHHELVLLAERAPADLAPVVRRWVPAQLPIDELNRLVQTFLQANEEVTQRWIEEEKARILDKLREKPQMKRALKTVRGVMQVGFGALSAYFTGGINVTDLLIGPLAERAMKNLLEMVGGTKFYFDLRRKFLTDRADMFHRFLDRRLGEPVRAQVPPPVPTTTRGEMLAALETLRSVTPASAEIRPEASVEAGARVGSP